MNSSNIFEEKIIESFEKDITTLCKDYSVLKMSEELFRFTLYQNFIKQKIDNKTILFEANENDEIKKIDFKFEDKNNKILIEMKFHRGLESKNQRPHPHSYGRLLADFLKLSQDSIKNYNRYVIYLFDEDYKEYYNKRLNEDDHKEIFILVDNEYIKKNKEFTLELCFKNENETTINGQKINKTMKNQINKFVNKKTKSKTINTKLIKNPIIYSGNEKKLYLNIYKIM